MLTTPARDDELGQLGINVIRGLAMGAPQRTRAQAPTS
jgi:hypothetical protein